MKYFTVKELCKSATADKLRIDNTPTPEIEANIKRFIEECLDPIRAKYGKPITVTSGYRCPKLNAAVKGVKNSDHQTGCAADLVGKNTVGTREIFEVAKAIGKYTQLLYEKNSKGSVWVHISYNPLSNKHQCLDNYLVK